MAGRATPDAPELVQAGHIATTGVPAAILAGARRPSEPIAPGHARAGHIVPALVARVVPAGVVRIVQAGVFGVVEVLVAGVVQARVGVLCPRGFGGVPLAGIIHAVRPDRCRIARLLGIVAPAMLLGKLSAGRTGAVSAR